jgi:hypothetical protein
LNQARACGAVGNPVYDDYAAFLQTGSAA